MAGTAAAEAAAPKKYRLHRIEIPVDSRYRDRAAKGDFSNPPDLCIEIYRNGELIQSRSQWVTGWDVEFSANLPRNYFLIDGSDKASFMIKVYDYDFPSGNELICTISGLTASDFKSDIRERLGEADDVKRALRIEFRPAE